MLALELFVQGLVQGSIYALIAVGLTLVYGLLRILHVAHAGLFTFGGYLGVLVTNATGSLTLALLAAMLVVGLTGMAIYRLCYQPILDQPPYVALIASIGLFIAMEELFRMPQDARPPAERANFCLHDNEALARYLVAEFVSHFGAFKGQAGLGGLVYRPLDGVAASGDPATSYSETVTAGDLTVRLTWSGLGKPFCFALPPDKSATGRHHMPSLFVGCRDATVSVNGRALPGKPVPREIAGHTITTAMLAFSETWIRA